MVWAPPTLTLDPLSSNSWRRPEDAGLQIGISTGTVNSVGNSPAKRGSSSKIETTVKQATVPSGKCQVYVLHGISPGANKAKQNKKSEDKKREEPEDDEDGEVVYSEVTVKPNQDGDVYVNVSAGSVENDNLYMNVEKSANSETQKPSENVGPDGTIYADLSFARSAPAAVKQHEDGDEDDDDKVVYAAIDFAKRHQPWKRSDLLK
ncbi:hypothetical protein LSAT2_012049 [Lamellibrachia satsuma]|nr:hypothetical protein LSAT2_012049 [Lamellibrachia satsuma]